METARDEHDAGALVRVRDSAPAIQPGVYVIHLDEVNDFLNGRIADPSDPRGTGYRGATPGVTERVSADLRKHLGKRVGFYKAITRRPPVDAWSRGWELVTENEQLKKAATRLDRRVRVWPTHMGAKVAFLTAHYLARRDGRALVYVRLAENRKETTKRAALEPQGVTGIVDLRVIPHDRIRKVLVHENADDVENYGRPRAYEIYLTPNDSSSLAIVHADRVLPFVEQPDEDSADFHGESALDVNFGNAQGLENVKWAATEAYFQCAAPYLVFTIDKDVTFSDAEKDNLKTQVRDLQSGVSQKIIMRAGTVTTIRGADTLGDPTPFARLHKEDAAAASGIPLRILEGNAAGALEAARYDESRYFGTVIQPLQEGFGTPVLFDWYARLQKWGLLPEGEIEDVQWYPTQQMDEKERASLMFHVGNALNSFARVNLPMPKEIAALITLPDWVDTEAPLELVVTSPFGDPSSAGGGPGNAVESLRRRVEHLARRVVPARERDLKIEVSPKLRRIEHAFEGAIRKAVRDWRAQLEREVHEVTGRPLRVDARYTRLARFFRADAPAPSPEDVQRAVASIQFDGEELRAIVEELLEEAADLGLLRTWREMGRGEILKFIETGGAENLRHYARRFTEEKAARASRAVRETIAESIQQGEGLTEMRERLRDTFGTIENEATIARTEAMRGYNHGSRAAMAEAGVRQWEWGAYNGADAECEARNGQRFNVDDVEALPPLHPQCRCVPIPVVEEAEA